MIKKITFSRLYGTSCVRAIALLWIILPCFCSSGYGQALSNEDLQLRLDGGTSLSCPESDKFSGSRPGPLGQPTEVGIGLYFLQIPGINDIEETFDADVYYLRYWKDPRLADSTRDKSYAFCMMPVDEFWVPVLEIRNLRETTERGGSYALIDAEGNILLVQRLALTVFSPMDLSEFPFDQQKLRIRLEPLFASDKEMVLYPLKRYVQMDGELYVNGWKLEDPAAEVSTEYAPLRGMNYSRMEIGIPVAREKGFFVRRLIIPIGLIVLMSWTIFWINPDQFAPQLGLGATSMLTIIAYQFALANSLPKISYHTRADNYILWSLVFVFLTLVEAGMTAGLVSAGKKQIALKIDHVCRFGFPIAYAIMIFVTLFI